MQSISVSIDRLAAQQQENQPDKSDRRTEIHLNK